MSFCDRCMEDVAERREREAAQDLLTEPPTERELLEHIVKLMEKQQRSLDKIRKHTGCLYAWLVLTLVLGALVLLVTHS